MDCGSCSEEIVDMVEAHYYCMHKHHLISKCQMKINLLGRL